MERRARSRAGRIYVFDVPSDELALRFVEAHDGPVTTLICTGAALASGGADGNVHLWAPPQGGRAAGSARAGALERVHTYSFSAATPAYHADPAYRPAVRPPSREASNPNHLTVVPKPTKSAKTPVGASATKPASALPTSSANGVGAIRSLCLVPLGAKRAVRDGSLQIPTLCAGTARCSIWRLQPQAGLEMLAGHFGRATGVAAHPTTDGAWVSCGDDRQLLVWSAAARLPIARLTLATPPCCLTYSSDGSLVAVGQADGGIVLLRPATAGAAALPAKAPPAHPSGGSGGVEVLAFAPAGSTTGGLLACGTHDRMVGLLEPS